MSVAERIAADLTSDEFLVDPLPALLQLQMGEPIAWSSAWGVWVVTRFDDVRAVLKDPATFSSERRFETLLARLPDEVQPQITRLRRHYTYGLIQSDPPVHTRLRLMVRDAFTPRAMDVFRPRIEALVDELLDGIAGRGNADLMADFAYVLPISVMCDLLAVPREDRERFLEWDAAIAGVQSTPAAEGDRAIVANDAIVSIEDYFMELVRSRRGAPGKDLISLMVSGHGGLEPLGDEELMAMCVGLLLGGHETTRSLLGSSLIHLLQRPDLLSAVRRDPDLIPPYVEEVLRFDGPIQRAWRRVTKDIEFGGRMLREGDLVYLMLNAADRDPDHIDEPDAFIPDRHPNQHLAFGHGIHFCVGAPLARLEAIIAVERILSRLPGIRSTGAPVWLPSIHQRTLASLPVVFDPAPPTTG